MSDDNQPFKSFVLDSVAKSIPFSLEDLINLGKQVQDRFPEMKIPAILNGISEVLLIDGEFTKENQPGIYLITGIDLVELRFTLKSRIKKIL